MKKPLSLKKVKGRSSSFLDSRKNHAENGDHKVGPEDKFFEVHFLVLLLGIIKLIPATFFVKSNDYWMYKFRNISSTDTNHRSYLQSNFASGSNIATQVPTVICMVLGTLFGYKMKQRTRILTSLCIMAACMFISTAFIGMNTDEWQSGFYAITMVILAVMNGIISIFLVSVLSLLSKLPHAYMDTFLLAQGVGGTSTSALQVLSLAVVTSAKASAFVYFIFGSLMTTLTLALFYLNKYSAFCRYHYERNPEDTRQSVKSFGELIDVSKKIWSSLVIGMAGALAYAPTHPAVAALVVSEFKGNGHSWNDKYFVAVVTFLYSDLCCFIGRIIATSIKKHPSELWLVVLATARIILYVPLFMLCNTLPKNHLPVWFPHDWQYVIILGTFMMSSGYFFNISFMNIPKLTPDDTETSYLLMQTFIGISGAVFSPLGVLCVDLL